MEHTAIPWTDETVIKIEAMTEVNPVPVSYRPLSEENWQYAKKCVNSHQKLVDALWKLLEIIQHNMDASNLLCNVSDLENIKEAQQTLNELNKVE